MAASVMPMAASVMPMAASVMPMAASVMPVALPPRDVNSTGMSNDPGRDCIYTFHNSHPLPSFDGAKCLKTVLLSPAMLTRFNKLIYKTKNWISVLYALGFTCGSSVLVTNAQTASWLAVLAITLTFPANMASYLVLRYDIVVLITKTFEFWYVTVTNVVCSTLMVYMFHDWRICMPVSSAIGYEIAFLMDAVYRGTTAAIVASTMGAAMLTVCMCVISFDLLDDVHASSILYANEMLQLTTDDVMLNGLGTVLLLLARNGFRKFKLLSYYNKRKTPSTTRTMGASIIMYRCCLELRPVTSHRTTESVSDNTPPQPLAGRIAFQFVDSRKTFDGRDILLPRWLCGSPVSITPWSQRTHVILWSVALLSHVSVIVGNILGMLSLPLLPQAAPIVAFTTSVVFCGVYFAHCQRQLLFRQLYGSFDFLFMSAQFTAAHLSICHLLDWDFRCLGVVTSWLWSHWLITLDAVTPVMKRKLGFDPRGALLVDAVLLVEQLILVASLFSPQATSIYSDRVLVVAQFFGHTKEVRVAPFLIWRMLMCFLWCSRLLWRLVDRKGDELLILQGQLHYDDSKLEATKQAHHGVVTSDGRQKDQQQRGVEKVQA